MDKIDWIKKYIDPRLIIEEEKTYIDCCDYCGKENPVILFINYRVPVLESEPVLYGDCCKIEVLKMLEIVKEINNLVANKTNMPTKMPHMADILERLRS